VVEKALATGRVRRVHWVLDRVAFGRAPDALGGAGGDFPMHLYRETAATPVLYLLSTDTLRLSVAALLGAGHRDLDSLNAWHADHDFGPARVLADWRRRLAIFEALRARPGPDWHDPTATLRRSVAVNLVRPVRAHPDVRFDLVFPPYSVLSYVADLARHPDAFAARQRYKAAVVRAAAGLPNVRVFDFQAVEAISHDLGRFKDLEHFDLGVNVYVLESIAAGRHRVEPERYGDLLARQRAQVERYRDALCAPGSPRRSRWPPALVQGRR